MQPVTVLLRAREALTLMHVIYDVEAAMSDTCNDWIDRYGYRLELTRRSPRAHAPERWTCKATFGDPAPSSTVGTRRRRAINRNQRAMNRALRVHQRRLTDLLGAAPQNVVISSDLHGISIAGLSAPMSFERYPLRWVASATKYIDALTTIRCGDRDPAARVELHVLCDDEGPGVQAQIMVRQSTHAGRAALTSPLDPTASLIGYADAEGMTWRTPQSLRRSGSQTTCRAAGFLELLTSVFMIARDTPGRSDDVE